MKKSLLSLAFAGLLLSPVQETKAMNAYVPSSVKNFFSSPKVTNAPKAIQSWASKITTPATAVAKKTLEYGKKAIMVTPQAVFVASWIKFYLAKPTNDEVRYSAEEMKNAVKAHDISATAQQAKFFIEDGIIGHAKQSRDDNAGKVRINSKGLYGWINSNYKRILSALAVSGATLTALDKDLRHTALDALPNKFGAQFIKAVFNYAGLLKEDCCCN